MNGLTLNGEASITSREIADLVGSRHDNVRVAIERLVGRGLIALPAVQEISTGGRPSLEFLFSGEDGKRDSIVVVAQLSPEFTARLVDRWRELEEVVQKSRFAIPQSLPDALRYAADLAEQKALVEVERDRAIATKAEIGSRREATAMATASTAARKAAQLEEELGRGCRQATVLAVEKATGAPEGSIKWQPLKQWCKDHGVVAEDVPCSRFGKAKAWPAGAWAEVYCVDLRDYFSPRKVVIDASQRFSASA